MWPKPNQVVHFDIFPFNPPVGEHVRERLFPAGDGVPAASGVFLFVLLRSPSVYSLHYS